MFTRFFLQCWQVSIWFVRGKNTFHCFWQIDDVIKCSSRRIRSCCYVASGAAWPPWIRVSHISVVVLVPGKNASSLLKTAATVMLPVRTISTRSLVDHSSVQHDFSKIKVQVDLD